MNINISNTHKWYCYSRNTILTPKRSTWLGLNGPAFL
jgi:hypothetical protein